MIRFLAFVVLLARIASGQQFEVASVKPSDPKALGGAVQFLPGGRFIATNTQLNFILMQVYDLKDYQIANAPKWISDWDSRFDIEAKAAGPVEEAQLRLMAQALLAERFQLRVHRDTKEMSVYFLTVGRKGFKIQPAPKEERLREGSIARMSPGVMIGKQVSMEALIRNLYRNVERPVLDRTNITQPFDFRLEWTPDNALAKRPSDQPPDDSRPSLFTALEEQLGLRLESRKAPVEVLVIDHIEKPSAN